MVAHTHTHTHENRQRREPQIKALHRMHTSFCGNRGAWHNCAPNFNGPKGKAPESAQNRFSLSFCTEFHDWLMLPLAGVSSENITPENFPIFSYLSF